MVESICLRQKIEHQDPSTITLDDILREVDTRYWQYEEWLEPELHIEDILETVDEARFMVIAQILHEAVTKLPGCRPGAYSLHDIMYSEDGELESLEERRLTFGGWLQNDYGDLGDMYDDESEDGIGILRHLYNLYLYRTLIDRGANSIQIHSAIETVNMEAFRRRVGNFTIRQAYAEFRNAGGSHEVFITSHLPAFILKGFLSTLELAYREGECAQDPSTMTPDDIARSVQEYIEGSKDDYRMLEVNYLYDTKDQLPYFYFPCSYLKQTVRTT